MMYRLERWRSVIEPIIQNSIAPAPWEYIVQQNIVLFDRPESVLLCMVSDWKGKKSLHITVAAGKMDEVNEMYLEAEEYARQHDCKTIIYVGRTGWLKTHGFKNEAVIGCKEL